MDVGTGVSTKECCVAQTIVVSRVQVAFVYLLFILCVMKEKLLEIMLNFTVAALQAKERV